MFDFEKLEVYAKAKTFNQEVSKFLRENLRKVDRTTNDQLRRASLSIMLNIAEGTSRFSNADKRNFYIIARGSAFECVAIFDFLKSENLLEEDKRKSFYSLAEELSKILFAMIKNLDAK